MRWSCSVDFPTRFPLNDYVGIVDVSGVDIGKVLSVGGQPALDVLVSFMTPEVLLAREDLLLWLKSGHYDVGYVSCFGSA